MDKQTYRTNIHEAVDHLLDAADADGREIDCVGINITILDVEESPLVEDYGVFHAEMADGEIEEMYVDHLVYKEGELQRPTKRFAINPNSGNTEYTGHIAPFGSEETIRFVPIDITSAELFGEAKDYNSSVHEALCQAIHEGSEEALEWLQNHVADIQKAYN